jgi:hypothetical protein
MKLKGKYERGLRRQAREHLRKVRSTIRKTLKTAGSREAKKLIDKESDMLKRYSFTMRISKSGNYLITKGF